MPGAAAWGSGTAGTGRARTLSTRDGCDARPARHAGSAFWDDLPNSLLLRGFVTILLEMTWQVAVFVAYRVAVSLPTLRWPFAGALIAIVGDFCDLFLMD